MTRFTALCLTTLLLAACASPPGRPDIPAAEPVREVFLQGLDEWLTSGSSATLQGLAQANGSDVWTGRAQGLLGWQAEVTAGLRSRGAEQQRQINHCREANEKFARENAALTHDLQELKRIMVEMERRNQK